MKFSISLSAALRFLVGAMAVCVSASAALADELNGTFAVSESWSVTVQVGTGASKTYTGKETGTLQITDGRYTPLDHTGIGGIRSSSRVINFDDGLYEIAGSQPLYAATVGFAAIKLTFFVIKIAVPAPTSWSSADPGRSISFTARGDSLADLSATGRFVDVNAPDAKPGYINRIDVSSQSGLGASDVPVLLSVSVNPSGGGTVTGNGTYPVGSKVKITASPAPASKLGGWKFSRWNDGVTANPRTVTVPVGGVTYTANFSPTAALTFYHEPEALFGMHAGLLGVGHAFVEVTSSTGATAYYGFYPSDNVLDGRFGSIKPDDTAPWDYAISYAVSDDHYRAAAAVIAHDLISPPIYWLTSFNCMDWAAKVATAAQIRLPPYREPTSIVSDPFVFGQALQGIGAGGTFASGAGAVVQNLASTGTARTSSASAGVTYDYSYSALEAAGHTNAAALATSLGFAYDHADLGTIAANQAAGLSLSLVGTSKKRSLISMNWGDGSAFSAQATSLSHHFASGTYAAHLLVIDSGAVHSYDLTVLVSTKPAKAVVVKVTSFPARSVPNEDLLPAEPVPDFAAFAALSGNFSGLFDDSGGSINITLTPSGAFSGKLTRSGVATRFIGMFDRLGHFTHNIGTSPLVLTQHLTVAGSSARLGNYLISGSAGGNTFTAHHAAYGAGQIATEAGKYTVALTPAENNINLPQDPGSAFMTVNKSGGAAMAGKLPDGTPFSCSGSLVGGIVGNQLIIDTSVTYPAVSANGARGALLGQLSFETLAASVLDGVLEWRKPPQESGLFPVAFDTHLNVSGSLPTPSASTGRTP